jgi:HSP20 family protein
MNRLFDGFLVDWDTGFPAAAWGAFTPRIDLTEGEKAFILSAELPGMTEKDIDLRLSGDLLTISGEKKNERKEQNGDHLFAERTFGAFSRTIRVPREVDQDKVQAEFRKGVLTVRLPKQAAAAPGSRKIAVSAE